jgi:nuclear transport factor 2 (NTF2) superfamily protein
METHKLIHTRPPFTHETAVLKVLAARFAYEWHDDSGKWFRSYGIGKRFHVPDDL